MTSVLTDNERMALVPQPKKFGSYQAPWTESDYVILLAVMKAAESAVVKRLAAGVSVEPAGEVSGSAWDEGLLFRDCTPGEPLYTADAIAAARVQENERCAKFAADFSGMETARAIRALLGKEQS